MKLQSSRHSTSFYEAFSDLIFGTMAIFVLLMLVFMIQVSTARETEDSRQSVDELEQKIKQLEDEVQQAQHESDEAKDKQKAAEQAASNLKPKPVDLVIAVDGTSSMGATLGSIQRNIESAAEIAARLSPRFRLGLIVYRDQRNTHVFPLTEIKPTVKGSPSQGLKQLRQFLNDKVLEVWSTQGGRGETGGVRVGSSHMVTRMEPLRALADVEYGIKTGLSMLGGGQQNEQRKVLIVAGDVGPWEIVNEDRYDDAADIDSQARLIRMAQQFGLESGQNRILSIYTGTASSSDIQAFPQQAIGFFKAFAAAVSEKQGQYSEDAWQIASLAVEAAVAKED